MANRLGNLVAVKTLFFAMPLTPCSPLDFETPLYQGCGATELLSLTIIVSLVCLPISLIAAMSLFDGVHVLFVSFALHITSTLAVVMFTAIVYRRIKYGKPEGWIIRVLACWMHPGIAEQLAYKSGHWRTCRENRL